MFDWITVILVLLIIGIVLDGIRRVRSGRKGNIKLSRNAKKADAQYGMEQSGLENSEFPSGGPRVIAYREENEARERTQELKQNFEAAKPSLGTSSRIPEQVSLNLEESVPMLMESIEIEAQKAQKELQSEQNIHSDAKKIPSGADLSSKNNNTHCNSHSDLAKSQENNQDNNDVSEHREPSIGSLDGLDAVDEYFQSESLKTPEVDVSNEFFDDTQKNKPFKDTELINDIDDSETQWEDRNEDRNKASTFKADTFESEPKKESLSEKIQRKIHEKIDDHFSDKHIEKSELTEEFESDQTHNNVHNEESKKEYIEPDIVLVVNIMASPGQVFAGNILLQALLNEGMKLGNMDIFHRHYENNGDAPVVFSLANMVMPGTFNLAEMSNFSTPGLSLFLGLPVVGDSLAAYNDLIVTAQRLAQSIGGELKDENRSVMTKQTIEHGKQRVIEYERKKKLAKA